MLREIDFIPYKHWGLNAPIKKGKKSKMLKYANNTPFLYYSS